ncbi:MAG TPA: sulfotransferase, partial [Turneriella sp.]|nr:sulfotransferase [Turneriella sp.]
HRPFHLVNLSFPRTATTSLAGIFQRHGATHEFMRVETINALLNYRDGKQTAAAVRQLLLERARLSGKPVDSAAFLFLSPEIVIETFPKAKFVFVVRDCESWIVSLLDMEMRVFDSIRRGQNSIDFSYHPRYARVLSPHFSEQMLLDEASLKRAIPVLIPELAHFWRSQSIVVFESMKAVAPANRLIIRLVDFSNAFSNFAHLAGVPENSLVRQNVHLNRDAFPEQIQKLIGPSFLSNICSKEQRTLDNYLNRNPGLLNVPLPGK